jgi:hypothetical protein
MTNKEPMENKRASKKKNEKQRYYKRKKGILLANVLPQIPAIGIEKDVVIDVEKHQEKPNIRYWTMNEKDQPRWS